MHGVGMGMDMHMRNRCRVEHWPPEHAAILPIDVTSINVDETRTKRKQKLVKWQHATKKYGSLHQSSGVLIFGTS